MSFRSLALLLFLLSPAGLYCQDHVVSPADLHQEIQSAAEARRTNQAKIEKLFSTEPVKKALDAAKLATLLAGAGPIDVIVPVPLDRRRRRKRGFNQSELLANELGRISGLRVASGALLRERVTATQTGLTHRQRRLNVQSAFRVRRPEAVAGRNIALIDDVITTGATAGACARVLKRAGAARVVVLALARARRRIVYIPPMSVRPLSSREASCTT